MAKVRIFEWAKENNRRSNEIVKKLKDEGHNVRNHTSVVDEDVLKRLFKSKPNSEKRHFSTGSADQTRTPKDKEASGEETKKEEVSTTSTTSTQGGYQGNRNNNGQQGGYQGNRNNNGQQGGYQGNRNNNGQQGGYQGNRNNNGQQGGYQGNRNNNGQQGGYQGNRQGGYQGNRDGQQGGYQGNRNNNGQQGGYQGNRQGGYQGNRNNNGQQGGYQGNRNNNGQQGGYQGNRNNNGQQGGYQGNRNNNGQQGGYQGNRQGGYQGNRDGQQGGYQGNRNGQQGGYQGNRNGQQGGYQGNRNGQQGGYQGNRNGQQGGYQGNRNGQQGGYQGNRNGQQGGYQGNRQGGYQGNNNGQGGGYQGNRQGGGYQGNRQGGGYQGNRQGGGYQGNRPGGYQGNRGGQGANKSTELEPTTTKPVTKKSTNKKRKPTYDRFAQFDNREGQIRVDQKTKTQMKKEARAEREKELKNETTILKWTDDMTVSKFASDIDIPAIDVISKLFELGIMATINQQLDKESAEILCTDYNVEIVDSEENQEFEIENLIPEYSEDELVKRPPIVTIMGHVDHGKTTLLDTIRNANVTAKESGGITQHIGAYQISHNKGEITFLDTPGHAAFTAMRARGAQVTDITVLVVAADDGVMPQTKEAVSHAKDAKTPLIVAVNKMDKPDATPDKVMSELAELGVLAEEWGGETPFVKVSAKNGDGIDELLDYIEVISELHDYKAPKNVPGFGTVIEANLDRGRGSVATILVQGGEVATGDSIVIGHTWGNIRVMQDEYGKRHRKVGASMPVEITGLKDVPQAGDQFVIMSDAKEAQAIGEKRSQIKASKDRGRQHAMSLEELNAMIAEGDVKELPVVIKADVQGSVEALASSLEQIEVNGVKVRVAHRGVGAINESDVMLAAAGNAIIIGFNVRPDANARQLVEKEKVEMMLSSIIYKIIEEIEDSMKGMREKKYREDIVGYARVDEVFKITGVGKVAGCVVTSGKITRQCKVRLIRDGVVVYDGDLGQLKRFKDDVKEVVEGMDCGMSFKDFNDIKKGDEFEGYILEEESLD